MICALLWTIFPLNREIFREENKGFAVVPHDIGTVANAVSLCFDMDSKLLRHCS